MKRSLASATLLALMLLPALSAAQEVYMSGLANPRGLFFDTDGTLFVAEAGAGGGSTGAPIVLGDGPATFGLTGGISTRLGLGAQTRLLSRLESVAAENGGGAGGVADISRAADGRLAVLFGLGTGSANRDTALGAAGARLGTLSYYDQATATWTTGEDYAARETTENPDGLEPNSNPFGLLRDGAGFTVADGGANALFRNGSTTAIPGQMVDFNGNMIPQQAVPTSVVVDPVTGDYLVGELGGFPFTPGSSRIHRVAADGTYLGATNYGFSSILDMTFAPDGSLLVLELADNGLGAGGPGNVMRIRPGETQAELLETGLITPTSLAFGNDGMLYVTNNALSPVGGEVVRFDYAPVPEPATLAALGLGAAALLRRRKRA